MMIRIMKGNSRLASEVDQRHDEEYKRGNKKKSNAVLVRQMEHRADERHDDQGGRDDGAHRGIEYRLVEQSGSPLETGNIGLEMVLAAIVIDDAMKELRSIDHAVHARNQHRDKCRDRAQQKCRRGDTADNARQLVDGRNQ